MAVVRTARVCVTTLVAAVGAALGVGAVHTAQGASLDGLTCDALLNDSARALVAGGFTLDELSDMPLSSVVGPAGLDMSSERVSCAWSDPGGHALELSVVAVDDDERAMLEAALEDLYFAGAIGPGRYGDVGRMYSDTNLVADGYWFRVANFWGEDGSHVAGIDVDDLRETVLAAGGTSPAATPAPQPAETIPTVPEAHPIACLLLLDPETNEALESDGFELWDASQDGVIGDTPFPADTDSPFVVHGGRSCLWGVPNSDVIVSFAYAPVTAAEAQAQQQRLVAEGFALGTTSAGTVLRLAAGQDAMYPEAAHLFIDGYWFYSLNGEGVIDQVRSNVAAQVALAVVEPTPTPEPPAPAEPAAPVAPVEPAVFGGATPSVLSTLRAVGDLDLTPATAAGTVAAASVLLALVALPGRLIEQTAGEHHERLDRRLAPVLAPPRRALARVGKLLSRVPNWLLVTLGILVVSVLAGFIEPEFGLNAGSLRLLASSAATFVLDGLLGLLIVALILRRAGERVSITFRAGSIVIVAAAVAFTRVTGFQPGLVFGLILTMVFLSSPTPRRELRAAGGEVCYVYALGLASWVAYSMVSAQLGPEPGATGLLVIETLAGLTVGSLSALPLVLLPLPSLLGDVFWRANRWGWAGIYLIALATFLAVVMPLPHGEMEIGMPLAVWVGLYVVYAALAVAFWAVMSFSKPSPVPDPADSVRRPVGQAPGDVDPPGGTADPLELVEAEPDGGVPAARGGVDDVEAP